MSRIRRAKLFVFLRHYLLARSVQQSLPTGTRPLYRLGKRGHPLITPALRAWHPIWVGAGWETAKMQKRDQCNPALLPGSLISHNAIPPSHQRYQEI